MSLAGYQCQKCWATFTDRQCCDRTEKGELKCPTCQSLIVKEVELPEDWVFGGLSGLCLG
jgi:DNA-directed RNA polymerase subunit RPC12/RpoP